MRDGRGNLDVSGMLLDLVLYCKFVLRREERYKGENEALDYIGSGVRREEVKEKMEG